MRRIYGCEMMPRRSSVSEMASFGEVAVFQGVQKEINIRGGVKPS